MVAHNMHAIVVINPDNESNVWIVPLHLQGVTPYLPVRKPTLTEWETGDTVQMNMTTKNLDWNPNALIYSTQEKAMTDHRGVVLLCPDREQTFVINTLSSMMTDAANITDNENFTLALEQQVAIWTKTAPVRIHFKAGKPVDAETLAKGWLVPANPVARTVDRKTQQGV